MFLKYLGHTKDFKYYGHDFSQGPCEVDDTLGKMLMHENPMTFTEVPAPEVKPEVKPKAKPKVKSKD